MARDVGKKLDEAVRNGDHRIDAADPDFKAVAEATCARLRTIAAALYPTYEAAQNTGDLDRADAIDDVLSRLDILRISIAQALVRYLDEAADVAAATAAIDAINCRLETAAAKATATAGRLDEVTAGLDDLTKLIGWVKGGSADA